MKDKNQQPEDEVDPAMMTMAERRKLFEKNKDVPKIMGRFGDSVTPAMIANAKPTTSNWERKRSSAAPTGQPGLEAKSTLVEKKA